MWIAFCHFHSADFEAAFKIYSDLIKSDKFGKGSTSKDAASEVPVTDVDLSLWRIACQFYMGSYGEAQEGLMMLKEQNFHPKIAENQKSLVKRLRLMLALKLHQQRQANMVGAKKDDTMSADVIKWHEAISGSSNPSDLCAVAAMHFMRGQYQEAIDIYKKLIAEDKAAGPDAAKYSALHVYLGLSYYKLDYYDVSQDILGPFFNTNKSAAQSITAINLKACNHYRLYHGKAAEVSLIICYHLSSLLNTDFFRSLE